jgi:hypothetical protein
MRRIALCATCLVLLLSLRAPGQTAADWRAQVEVTHQAESLEALLAKAKPSITWGDGDMMWITEPEPGKPVFILNHAIRPPSARGDAPTWALVKTKGDADYVPFLDGQFGYEKLEVVASPPQADGAPPSHALEFDSDPEVGTLYRIRWTSGPTTSPDQVFRVRDLFVLRRGDRWKFLGEGPSESFGRGDRGTWFAEGTQYHLEWVGRDDKPLNLTASHWRMTAEDADLPARADLVTRRDGVLDFARHGMKWDDHEYVLSCAGDTMDAVIERLAAWRTWPAWKKYPDRRPALTELIRPQVLSRNPQTPRDATLPTGSRVFIPCRAELEASIAGSPATRPANTASASAR